MTEPTTLLYFRDEKHYHTAVDVIAGYPNSDPVHDLRECADPDGPFTVALGAALDAVRQVRKTKRKKKPSAPRQNGWRYGLKRREQPGGDAA